tara:strand:- start:17913 stop:18380 length:468 start_codon:yes stop_codon:yes gene_type:complete
MRLIILFGTHMTALAIGFALGVYFLPIIIAPPSVDRTMLADSARGAMFEAAFSRELNGSDFLHWGEGSVSVSANQIVHQGALAPGPDYKVYLVTTFVQDEADFLKVKYQSAQVGDVKTFDGFIVDIPPGVDVTAYNTVVVWCETFGEFITAAQYR